MKESEVKTPTDALIAAMEECNELRDVLIVGRYEHEGKMCIYSSTADGVIQLGMLEMAKAFIVGGGMTEDED